ncbi:F-box protein CPR1-like [Papaver somniferum]|uniref:F-box protein CPR1-like n=1 Tax=Papaver somniferum TaxID=3469 RepID=UPI000E6F556E|nr:F-box protein CPR1-like [Papaver somniferum]
MGGIFAKSSNMNGNRMGTMEEKDTMYEKQLVLMPHLPEEIIIQILSRLSPRYLLKFRCVSKPWSVLFNNPKLVDMIKNHFIIMVRYGKDMYSIDNESLSTSSSLLDDIDSRIEKIHCPVVDNYFMINFVACCNGLFCIRTAKCHDFSLWNPSNGDYKRIPSAPDQFQVDKHSMSTLIGCGLGYDSESDDYKFVCIISNLTLNQSEAKIYSLRSNLWKPIQQISYVLSPQTHKYGVFCNGALHWLSSSSPTALIALHMTDELIRVISPPENPNFEHIGDTACIDVLDGCLGMLYCNVDLGFEVWLMKDYGKKESWTKFYSISKLAISLEMGRFGRLRRIKCLKTGEILLEIYHHSIIGGTREALVLYDPKNETSKFLKHDKDKWSSSSLSFHSYVKSSVSVSTKH